METGPGPGPGVTRSSAKSPQRRLTTPQRPWLGAAVIASVAVIAIAVFLLSGGTTSLPGLPAPRTPAASAAPAVGPVVYSEILDADGAVLVERRLDGHSLPRRVAVRTDVDYGRTWTVDPAGTIAIAAVPANDQMRLQAVSIADGSDLWAAEVPPASLDEAAWSDDGHRLALINRPDQAGQTLALIVDTRDGRVTRAVVPDASVFQGFDPHDALIVRVRAGDLPSAGWQFFRVDPATNVVERLTDLPDVGPAGAFSDDVDPRRGFGVALGLGPNDQGTAIQAIPAGGGPPRNLGVFPSVDQLAIDPSGTGVAFSANDTIRFVAWDGRAQDVWSGDDSVAAFGWSLGGDYFWVAGNAPTSGSTGARLTIIEHATGRSVAIPQVEPVAQTSLVRIIGGVPLPDPALPAVEPTPTPTPAPAGPDVAAAPELASGWFDTSGHSILLHVERLVPTSEGGMRAIASMPPIDLGPVPVPDDAGRNLLLLPRPRAGQLLVWVEAGDHSRGWLWDGTAAAAKPIPLPRDWPTNAFDVAWRPDGKAVAASAGRPTLDGDFEGIFAIAELGAKRTTVIPLKTEYNRLEGWWSSNELRVGHGICTEGCEGRYAFSARLRIRDGRVTQLTAADRARAPIDEVNPDGHGGLVMSVINEDPADDIRIDWPVTGGSSAGPSVVDVGDGPAPRALIVSDVSAGGTDLYRIDDPIGRAVKGRLVDPQPVAIGHLPRRGLDITISPDQLWAITVDRVQSMALVELATGRSWPIDRDRTLAWWPSA